MVLGARRVIHYLQSFNHLVLLQFQLLYLCFYFVDAPLQGILGFNSLGLQSIVDCNFPLVRQLAISLQGTNKFLVILYLLVQGLNILSLRHFDPWVSLLLLQFRGKFILYDFKSSEYALVLGLQLSVLHFGVLDFSSYPTYVGVQGMRGRELQIFVYLFIHSLSVIFIPQFTQQITAMPISLIRHLHYNNFIMDYNQFTYYRANPYAAQGYMPPTAFINRHRPDFLTELPMGEQHMSKIGKRQYSNNAHRSHIETDNILKSPQRYPYENRIALDKGYERNLNTIDIEGASGGTLVSQAMKNKMKARESLIRRQESENMGESVKLEPIKSGDAFEEEKRRKVAYMQYLRDQQAKQLNESNRPTKGNDDKNNNNNNSGRKGVENVEEQAGNYYMNLRNRKNKLQHSPLIKARYQSIEIGKGRDNSYQQDQSHPYSNNNIFESLGQNRRPSVDSSSYEANSRYGPKQSESGRTPIEKPQEVPYEFLAKDRKSLRYQNPTNLSSQGSIHYAARNIIKGQ